MKTNILTKATLSVLSLGCLASCSPKASSPTMITSGIAMTATAKAATVASYNNKWSLLMPLVNAFVSPGLVDSTGTGVNLTNAWVSIKEIEFEAEEAHGTSETDGTEISFKGPYFIDLLSSSPTTIDTQQIPANTYHRIKMKLHASGGTVPQGTPAQLASNSIFIQGVVGARNFTFQLDDSTQINIGGPKPLVPADGLSLLVEINLANLFKQINFASITNNEVVSSSSRHAGANLCVSIDPNANDLYTCIRKGLEKHANFGEDLDNNHDLGANEDSVK